MGAWNAQEEAGVRWPRRDDMLELIELSCVWGMYVDGSADTLLVVYPEFSRECIDTLCAPAQFG